MIITNDGLPKCEKCTKTAICYMSRMWVCGQCLHENVQKREELHRKEFLEG